ncbi:hypothetical protein AAMO2058_001685900 [Amorphochlora amoebiformis]
MDNLRTDMRLTTCLEVSAVERHFIWVKLANETEHGIIRIHSFAYIRYLALEARSRRKFSRR